MPEPTDQTDDVIARKFAETPVPTDLRERIIAASRPAPVAAVEASRDRWWTGGITAIAASILLSLLALGGLIRPAEGEQLGDARREMAAFLSGDFDLEMVTPDLSRIQEWFAAQHDGAVMDVPAALAAMVPEGCREIEWRGHRGTLVCFQLPNGRVAHLVTFPRSTFVNPPGARPLLAKAGEWMEASWTNDGMTYLLFAPGGLEGIRELI